MKDRGRQIGAAADAWTRKHWSAGGGSVLFLVGLLLIFVLIVAWGAATIGLPQNPVDATAPLATQVALPQTKDPNDALDPKDRLALQRDLTEYAVDSRTREWTLIAQVIGAAVLAVGGYFTWRNLRVTQERLDVDRQAQITNRFTQAIGQLGAVEGDKPNLEVRLGGIYALERIARDSLRDHGPIIEILTAYVRRNAGWTNPPTPEDVVPSPKDALQNMLENVLLAQPQELERPAPPRTDIQAILTVVGRRTRPGDQPESARLDLHGTDLRSADLSDAHLELADLKGTHLEGAFLDRAHLEQAILVGAYLRQASLDHAHLEVAFLQNAHLEGAILKSARLEQAVLWEAQLKAAILLDAHLEQAFLHDASLERAILEGAYLDGANLERARLDGAFLRGAHLDKAKNLTQEQVYSAYQHGENAFLPVNWPADWRDRFENLAKQPPAASSAP